jgi:acylphosphatase
MSKASNPAEPVSRCFVVDGRVQGVGFRYFVVREAQALGLAGWVRNLPDGRVEVLASGEPDIVSAFEGRLWEGPPHAKVTSVETRNAEAPQYAGFRVLPTPW